MFSDLRTGVFIVALPLMAQDENTEIPFIRGWSNKAWYIPTMKRDAASSEDKETFSYVVENDSKMW